MQQVVRSKKGEETKSEINPGRFRFSLLGTNAVGIPPVQIREFVEPKDSSSLQKTCIAIATTVNKVAAGTGQERRNFALVVRKYSKVALAFSAASCFVLLLAWLACGEVVRRSGSAVTNVPPAL